MRKVKKDHFDYLILIIKRILTKNLSVRLWGLSLQIKNKLRDAFYS